LGACAIRYRGVAARILIIDSDPAAWADVQRSVEAEGNSVVTAASAPAALAALSAQRFDLVLCDRRMPFREGSPLAAELTRRLPDGRCAMTSDEPLESLAAEALASGWSEVLTRPAPAAAVLLALRRARERSRLRRRTELAAEDLARAASLRPIVAASRAMIDLLEQVERVAGRRGALLVVGEPGSGREGIARAVHAQSSRRGGPFVIVDCARGSEREREHRLFGGARSEGLSAIRDAATGTLYIDAIETLPVSLQMRLAAALREADAPGGGAPHAIAAASGDLDELVRRGAFWKELYELLRLARVRVPALRERPEDIPLLVDHFLAHAASTRGRAQLTVTGDALDLLIGYRWPGNVRELASVLERAVDRASHDVLSARELPEDLAHAPVPENPLALRSARRAFETDLIRRALRATAGNRTRAARLLEISHRALLYKLKELAIRD